MRALPLLALVCCLALAVPAYADEAPDFTAETLIFVQDDLPSGWKLLDSGDCPPELPSEDRVTEAGGEDVDSFAITCEYRLVKAPGGMQAVVAIVDVDLDEDTPKYINGLKAIAAPNAWKVVELGHAQRVMLVAAPAEKIDELVSWQKDIAARNLMVLAYDRLLSDFQDGKSGKLSMERAGEYASAALSIRKGMSGAKAVQGMVMLMKDDKEGGISTVRKALGDSGKLAATPRMRFFGWGLIGRALINDTEEKPATAQQNKDAVEAFKNAMRYEDQAIEEANERNDQYLRLRVWGTRYNMCCGLVRIKSNDEAFKELETCMTIGKRLLSLGNRWQRWFEHAWFWDKDLEPIRKDPRFMPLMKKVAPDEYDWEKRTPELEKAKKQMEEQRAKQEAAKKAGEKKDGGAG
ncbi:MAG: hypothetical protein QNJ98_16600 [Planctomycetota bacterium]|nr:hypothetical protein [Planctomycetota bacterium]